MASSFINEAELIEKEEVKILRYSGGIGKDSKSRYIKGNGVEKNLKKKSKIKRQKVWLKMDRYWKKK